MYLVIDIGGTKTLIALFSKHGRVLKRLKFRTPQGSKTFLNELSDNLASFRKYNVKSVVVAVPGVVQKNCSVVFGNRNWGNFDVCTTIKKLFRCPIYLENDANLAALYESYRLPGRTIFLTFSTGIGGGIVEKNRILPISDSFEPGHRVYYYENSSLEWEDIAAASAIEKHYHIDYATNIRKKDHLKDVAKRVYLGIPDIIKEYHPDNIVLGGPLGRIFKLYIKYFPPTPSVKFRRPKRPLESVIYGGYLYAKQKELE